MNIEDIIKSLICRYTPFQFQIKSYKLRETTESKWHNKRQEEDKQKYFKYKHKEQEDHRKAYEEPTSAWPTGSPMLEKARSSEPYTSAPFISIVW